jgi:hypothetical protein
MDVMDGWGFLERERNNGEGVDADVMPHTEDVIKL